MLASTRTRALLIGSAALAGALSLSEGASGAPATVRAAQVTALGSQPDLGSPGSQTGAEPTLPQTGQAPVPSAPSAPAQSFAPETAPNFTGEEVTLLMAALGAVDKEGFRPGEFTPPGLDALLRSPREADRAQGAIVLRRAVLAYARAQHGVRVTPSTLDKNWGLKPGPYDAAAEFEAARTADALQSWINALPPPIDRYQGLRQALASYREIQEAGGWGQVEDGPVLRLGSKGPRVLQLRRRLAAEDADLSGSVTSSVFDAALEAALKRFQHNVGLNQTGLLDHQTVVELDVPVSQRILQIRANMERWRWYPRTLPATRIEANIAGEEMDAYQNGGIVLEMRAAPGRPDDQTPILASEVRSVVFDPPWNVPSTIAKKELLPKEAAHPGYLAAHGYRKIGTDDGGFRIQQVFGRKSALGKIKFDFPNDYAVYLHDTPSRAAFSKTSRAVSHGCVRLQRPKELADLLFQSDPTWTPDKISDVIAKGDTVRAALPEPVPIFLMYWTVFLDVKGRVNFRDDVYGWDGEVMGRIAAPAA